MLLLWRSQLYSLWVSSKAIYQTINYRAIGGAYQRFKCFKRCRGSIVSQTRYIGHNRSINNLYGTKDFT